MSGSIQMDNIYSPEHEGGALQWLLGKNVTSMVFSNVGADNGYVGIAAPSPARILPVSIQGQYKLDLFIQIVVWLESSDSYNAVGNHLQQLACIVVLLFLWKS